MDPQRLLFFAVSSIVLIAGAGVVLVRHPVKAVLLLVLAFFSSAILWLLAGAEFLAVTLVVVYVGAVMVLFLFVVMMLDVDTAALREGFNRYLPFGIFIAGLIAAQIIWVVGLPFVGGAVVPGAGGVSNIQMLGRTLYTDYVYHFELAGVILLIAIVAAIALTFRGRRANTKGQSPSEQMAVQKKDRVRLVEGGF